MYERRSANRNSRFFSRGGPLLRGALVVVLVAMVVASPVHTTIADPASTLPLTISGIHFGMDNNYQEPTVNGYKTQEDDVDYVFGADDGMTNIPASNGRTLHDKYLSWSRDAAGTGVQQPISWYRQHHPDWLLYTNDRTTIPIAYGDHIAPLDFTNPAVQQYVITNWIEPALAGGYQGIGFDNDVRFNYLRAAGHYTANGSWVQLFTGNWDDPTYASAQVAAFQAIVNAVHAAYPSATVALNQGDDCNDNQTLMTAGGDYADIIMDQEGFTNSGSKALPYIAQYANAVCPNGKWLTVAQWAQHLGQAGKGLFLVNPEPYSVSAYQTDTDAQARFDLQWSLANYLLVKYAHTYFWWGAWAAQNGYPIVPQHEYTAAQTIGSPTDDFYASQNVYMRDFTNGLAVVNPALSTSYTVSFPAGQYADLYGTAITSYTMPPHSGLVLLNATPSTVPLPTMTSSPLPTATLPVPTASTIPSPTATNTAVPTATNTPSPTSTPIPTTTNTPIPTPTNTPSPTATSTPPATAASTPTQTTTSTPTSTSVPTSIKYRIVLGSRGEPVSVGTAVNVTITAVDSSGTPVTSYQGTIHFSSSDSYAALPADYTFKPADHGSHTFSLTAWTPGVQTIGVTDSTTGSTITSVPLPVGVMLSTGWNALDVPLQIAGGLSLSRLVTALDGHLGQGAITQVLGYQVGHWRAFLPGYSPDHAVQPGEGLLLFNRGSSGIWVPAGAPFRRGQAIPLQPGWNLVAAPYPYHGVLAGTIVRQVTGCQVQEIRLLQHGSYRIWQPATRTSGTFKVPATSGVWIECRAVGSWHPR